MKKLDPNKLDNMDPLPEREKIVRKSKNNSNLKRNEKRERRAKREVLDFHLCYSF